MGTFSPYKAILIGFIPDGILAYFYSYLINGDGRDFWWALLVLLGLQAFFGIKNWVSGLLVFKLGGKESIATNTLNILRKNKFPKPEDPVDYYFTQTAEDENTPFTVRLLAAKYLGLLEGYSTLRPITSLRLKSALELALHKYEHDF